MELNASVSMIYSIPRIGILLTVILFGISSPLSPETSDYLPIAISPKNRLIKCDLSGLIKNIIRFI
jgi:hypothetical protein